MQTRTLTIDRETHHYFETSDVARTSLKIGWKTIVIRTSASETRVTFSGRHCGDVLSVTPRSDDQTTLEAHAAFLETDFLPGALQQVDMAINRHRAGRKAARQWWNSLSWDEQEDIIIDRDTELRLDILNEE